jgi:hypothetical protein
MWTEPINSSDYQTRLKALRHRLFAHLRAQAAASITPASGSTRPDRPDRPDDNQSPRDQVACEP